MQKDMFDHIVRLTCQVLKVPIAYVLLVESDGERTDRHPYACMYRSWNDIQIFKNERLEDEPILINDTFEDTRFANCSLVDTDTPIRFYASVPLHSREGLRIGNLCIIDHVPRRFGAKEICLFQNLAQVTADLVQCMPRFGSGRGSHLDLNPVDTGGDGTTGARLGRLLPHDVAVMSAQQRQSRKDQLANAIEHGELILHYQPKVDLKTGQISGLEALVRWEHPMEGLIPPAAFIPLAEESGLILPLGRWVLHQACLQIKAWQSQRLHRIAVAVNLSSKQFLNDRIIDDVKDALKSAGLGPGCLEVELTESLAMSNPELSARYMAQLREMGVSVSIDDFGTGYSSLSHLKKLPFDKVKIDRSFITDITESNASLAIVQAVIAMAHRLGLKVVAEGVENEKQLAFLSINQCDEMQGYYFSKPLSSDACTEFLMEEKRLKVNQQMQATIAALFGGH